MRRNGDILVLGLFPRHDTGIGSVGEYRISLRLIHAICQRAQGYIGFCRGR
jgi:hypothetical protein